ncbi:hypothetical protein OGCDGJMD_00247 [Cyanobium usitatum str. Tous]|jgi:hypothetical protein|uniref:nucleotidyltransferase substrate binding protein n=1 Tax=Cyanobium usitatum TaxID=2304190 RepID=UPI002AD3A26F|nr:nucleotidyltransferase substrate binding protein [Cyanobium usitatum]CAK6687563.1 hypothetical protein OGCDGJMD_00247 [Cyanobium usitatum str. Tous]
MAEDIRWQQGFSNYRRALAQLETFLEPPRLTEREQLGLIKAYEYTFELAWNTLREAFRLGLIEEGEAWMLMIQGRNLTSHTYNRATAEAVAVDDLLLPWRVDLALRHELPDDLEAHVQRVGRCLWRKACRPSVNA